MSLKLILGGARSGKSSYAQNIAENVCSDRIFVATAEAFDDEMRDRIARHQFDRDESWKTIEAPLELADAVMEHSAKEVVCLVDCLTLWLSNIMLAERDVEMETDRLLSSLRDAEGTIILVSNEVGMGLVPETPIGRAFRDAQGRLNQKVAALCDQVEFIAAGLPITLKS